MEDGPQSYASILEEALEDNFSLTGMSHSDTMSAQARLYLDLNRHGRK
jgi:hypothetical protein